MSDTSLLVGSLAILSLAAIIVWPQRGLAAQWRRGRRDRERMQIEDALKHIHAQNRSGRAATTESLSGALRRPLKTILPLVERMQHDGLIQAAESGWRLTPSGNECALHIIRAHRLWERHLADQAGWALADLHAEADRREHSTSADVLTAMEAELGYPRHDPHGDPIPSLSGELADNHYPSLDRWPVDTAAHITHIEDEPREVFAQIIAQGLKPGQAVRVIESTPARVVFEAGDTQHVLAPVIAANVFVDATPVAAAQGQPLRALQVGERAAILALSDACQGLTRRRFLDLGLTPGTIVEAALSNPFKDPVAYRVRGTLIALRGDQAEKILIDPNTIAKGNPA